MYAVLFVPPKLPEQHYNFPGIHVCASITNNIRYTSQTQQIYYGVQGRANDMFRPFYSNTAIIRSSKVT